ncbi:MAG: hypothetical protein PWQ33_823 [Pseudothermotoga sp.]|jgi:hypothetical protein|nr:MAG: hypothetical protein XD56_0132 [Pseudothermotoga lettingae]MDK2884244.1 hypothetical protein [Pseudothermotoga sp.]
MCEGKCEMISAIVKSFFRINAMIMRTDAPKDSPGV